MAQPEYWYKPPVKFFFGFLEPLCCFYSFGFLVCLASHKPTLLQISERCYLAFVPAKGRTNHSKLTMHYYPPHPRSQCFSTRHRRIGSSSVFSGGCSRVRIYRVFWKLWLQIAVEWLMIGVMVKFCCHVRRYMQVCHAMLQSAL